MENKQVLSVTITRYDYIIRNVNDEELDLHGHRSSYTEYDRDGRLVKEIRYDRSGNVEDMHLYRYNERGFLITDAYYPEEDLEAEKTTYEHNDRGLPVKSTKQYLDGSTDTVTYFYDDTDRLIRTVTTSDDEPEEVETFGEEENPEQVLPADEEDQDTRIIRNDQGQVILEEVFSSAGELITRISRRYNEDGSPHETEVFIDGEGKTITRHYFLQYEYIFHQE
jgi:hypothetical protein